MALVDRLLAGTPFRGLVIQGFRGYCAYIGVPRDHWLADMDGLVFNCYGEITFRGPGDGCVRPEGWYWYGWDYQHLCDKSEFPNVKLDELPPELAGMLEAAFGNGNGKTWTLPEVEQDLIDAAISLLEVMDAAQAEANDVAQAVLQEASKRDRARDA